MTQSARSSTPRKAYRVEERLIGTAIYYVHANTRDEAAALVRGGGQEMIDSHIDHMGRFKVRRAPSEDR